MEPDGPEEAYRSFLSSWGGENARIDRAQVISGTTAYLVRSFDNETLQFSFPVLIQRNLLAESGLDPAGADGAVSALIEQVQEEAEKVPALGPLYGKGTVASTRYRDTIEPYTIIHSDAAIGSGLWKADSRNFCDATGVHLVLRGAIPCPRLSEEREGHRVAMQLADLAEAAGKIIRDYPLRRLEPSWLASLDQKVLRTAGEQPKRNRPRHPAA
jgi:predicted ABC-class ATPase